ncbi:MAG: hypothetical protein P4L82_09700 [Ancalomicrobiaceae bacterium]|nr:hypothetical protein [Ancalomicrobiaceae bacterium]
MLMRPHAMSRRAMLALALAALGGAAPALAAKRHTHPVAVPPPVFHKGVTMFRTIEIDTRPMAERGLSNYALRIQDLAGPVAARIFSDRFNPHAPEGLRLVLRINSIELRQPMSGHNSRFDVGSGGDNQDWIEGSGVVLDNSGHVFATVPITTSASSNIAGLNWSPEGEQLRTQGLIELLARWVKQDV